jgi:hypothetical protein
MLSRDFQGSDQIRQVRIYHWLTAGYYNEPAGPFLNGMDNFLDAAVSPC